MAGIKRFEDVESWQLARTLTGRVHEVTREGEFGRDFSGVRIHTGSSAHSAAESVAARAFAFKQNIVFGAGEYEPGSDRGRRLIAHELTHVVQQSRGAPATSQLVQRAPAADAAAGMEAARTPVRGLIVDDRMEAVGPTQLRKSDFLASLMISRLLFMVPEVLFLLVFAWLVFGVTIAGSLEAVVFLILLGAFSFAGLGLLIACRAKTMETVSGLMNLAMFPGWIFSGVFFSTERFPDALQPAIQALPLTALNDALRAVMLEGAGVAAVAPDLAILLAWGGLSFLGALKLFRWQ